MPMSDCVLMVAGGDVLCVARTALREAGYTVISVSDVDMALGLLRTAAYDVVVADLDAFKQAGGAERVNGKLSLLFHQTRDIPVVLGCSSPERSSDLVNLCDMPALLEQVNKVKSKNQNERPYRSLSF